MPVKLNSTGGGSVTLDVPAVGTTTTLNLPTQSGSVVGADTSGNVGIGTSSPARRLDIQQGGTNYQLRIGDAGGANFYDIGRDTSNGLLTFYGSQAVASGYVFSTVNGERARITSGGNLLIGTTSLVSVGLVGVDFGATGDGIAIRSTTTGDRTPIAFFNGNGFVGRISTSGSSTSYLTSSDYRLKENVTPLTGAAARVQALKPSRFNFIVEPDRVVDGFLAHEAAEVVPEAVFGEKDAVNEDGSIKPQGIDQSKLVPLLTAALQEALTRIETLEARLAAVEAR